MTTKKTAKKKAPKKTTIKEFSCRFSSDMTNAELMRMFKDYVIDFATTEIKIWDSKSRKYVGTPYTRKPKFTDLGEK